MFCVIFPLKPIFKNSLIFSVSYCLHFISTSVIRYSVTKLGMGMVTNHVWTVTLVTTQASLDIHLTRNIGDIIILVFLDFS